MNSFFKAAILAGAACLAGCATAQTATTRQPTSSSAAATAAATNVEEPHSHWEAYDHVYASAPPSVDQRLTDPLLKGAIDLHAHFGPDAYTRQWDGFEIARMMHERGMRGMVIKNHFTESGGTAYLIREHANVPGLEVFGSLSLNAEVGGMNPQAVRYFAENQNVPAKVVWMPTHDSAHEVQVLKQNWPMVHVSEGGVLLPEVLEVLDLMKKYDLTLATGHVTPQETLMIIRAAKQRGIDNIIFTHPNLGPMFTDPSPAELKQAVELGATVEVVASVLRGANKDRFIQMIRTLGPQNVVVSTDSGLVGTPNHPDAMVMAIRTLREAGFSDPQISLMVRENPARLLGLAP